MEKAFEYVETIQSILRSRGVSLKVFRLFGYPHDEYVWEGSRADKAEIPGELKRIEFSREIIERKHTPIPPIK